MKKADEWRRLLTITPVLLWWTWKDANDEIPDAAPSLPHNAVNVPDHSRNTRHLYAVVLILCAAVRMLAARTISMAQGRLGHRFLVQYLTTLLDLRVHLVINHHMAMHYLRMIKLFGPVYAWWLFAF